MRAVIYDITDSGGQAAVVEVENGRAVPRDGGAAIMMRGIRLQDPARFGSRVVTPDDGEEYVRLLVRHLDYNSTYTRARLEE